MNREKRREIVKELKHESQNQRPIGTRREVSPKRGQLKTKGFKESGVRKNRTTEDKAEEIVKVICDEKLISKEKKNYLIFKFAEHMAEKVMLTTEGIEK